MVLIETLESDEALSFKQGSRTRLQCFTFIHLFFWALTGTSAALIPSTILDHVIWLLRCPDYRYEID